VAFLELNQVTYIYQKCGRPAVSGIDLTFDQCGITAVIGPNGSGKTTLSKLMAGILRPDAGEVRLENRPLGSYSLAGIGRRIGYVFQNPDQQLFCNTVAEEIGFGLQYLGWEQSAIRERVKFLLDYFQLASYRDAFPLHLSRGERQRLAIAAVLAGEPAFLVLDEPTVGLDAYRKRLLADYLSQIAGQGRGVVLVSHDSEFVGRVAERVIRLENGCVRKDDNGDRGHAA
jgi:energy-coupling factor transport system ATP-binding protein